MSEENRGSAPGMRSGDDGFMMAARCAARDAKERVDLVEFLKSLVDVGPIAHLDFDKLESEGISRDASGVGALARGRVPRVVKDEHAAQPRRQVAQHLQALRRELRVFECKRCHVAAWSRQALHKARAYRVAGGNENDGQRGALMPCAPRQIRANREKHGKALTGELVQCRTRARIVGARYAHFDNLYPSRCIALLAQPRPEPIRNLREAGFLVRTKQPDSHAVLRKSRSGERQHQHQCGSEPVHRAAATAAVTSRVRALPPKSGVNTFFAVTASMACMSRAAAFASPRCSSIIAPVQNVAIGLATPLPVMSNAEPWIGSNIDGNLRSGFRFAVGAMPSEPESAAARSDRISA